MYKQSVGALDIFISITITYKRGHQMKFDTTGMAKYDT